MTDFFEWIENKMQVINEMGISVDEQDRIRTIIDNLIQGNKVWFDQKNILVGNKSGSWILNYLPGPKNEYNKLVRGMVVKQPDAGFSGNSLSLIQSFPFTRFFNQHEPDADPVDLSNAEMIEKLDGCFAKDTKISFCNGKQIRIKDVVDQKLEGPIWGFDHSINKMIPTKILAWHDNGISNNWVTVKIENPNNGNKISVIHCTPNHLFWSNDKYIQAHNLSESNVDIIRNTYGKTVREIIFGTLLGGCSLNCCGGWRIAWTHSNKQRSLTEWYCRVLNEENHYVEEIYDNGGYGKNKHRCTICHNELFEEFAEICLSNKKKDVNESWIKELSLISLAAWYMDDGSISYGRKGKQRPRALFHSEGFTVKENELLIEKLNSMGYKAVKQQYRGYTCIRLNADAATKFWTDVAPFIIQDLRYKLPENLRDVFYFWDNFIPEVNQPRIVSRRVLSVSEGNYKTSKLGNTKKYDLTTETNNYFANNTLVHNSMIGLFFPTGDLRNPQWHTRKMTSGHTPDMNMKVRAFTGESFPLMQLIGRYIKQLRFDHDEDLHHTYVFEFIHAASTVLTKYNPQQFGLYLLAVRNLQTHREESENALDEIAARIGANRPRRWDSVADSNDIAAMMKQAASEVENFEGYVFRDKETGKRIKLKDAHYVKMHHILGSLSFKRLIPKVLEGEEDEIISYFPSSREKIMEIKQKHMNYVKYVADLIKDYKGFANRKELADLVFDKNSEISDSWAKFEIMKLHQMEDKNIEFMVDDDLIKLGLQYLPSYMSLVGYKPENDEDNDEEL